MQNKKKKYLAVANVFLLLLLIAGATYAWFAINLSSNVAANNVTIKADGSLELSINQTDWETALNINADSYDQFKNLKFIDVSGIGDGVFYHPNDVDDNGNAVNDKGWIQLNDNDMSTDTDVNKSYMKFTLYMRSEEPLQVSLGAATSFNPAGSTLTGVDSDNKSKYGDFSRDCIVGAMRVSMCDQAGDRMFTWLPRPEIRLEQTDDVFSIRTDVTDNVHTYITDTTGATASISPSDGDDTYYAGDFNFGESGERELLTLTKVDESSNYYTGQVTIYVWLEGCDTEARRALVGGRFSLNIKLVSEDATIETP